MKEYIIGIEDFAGSSAAEELQRLIRCKDCRYWKHKYMDYPMHDELPCMHYQTDGDWFCGSGQPIPQEETYVYFNDGSVGKITYLGTLNPEKRDDT